jgi:hypothetical protein
VKKQIWANAEWEVADDGLASLGDVDQFIPRDRLCELRSGRENEGIASWPLNMADKSWVKIDEFLEAYEQALQLLQPRGRDEVDLSRSSELARDRAFANMRNRR